MFAKYSSCIKGPVLKKYRTPTQNTGPSRPQCGQGFLISFIEKLEAGTTACNHVFSYNSNDLGNVSTQRVITSKKKQLLIILFSIRDRM